MDRWRAPIGGISAGWRGGRRGRRRPAHRSPLAAASTLLCVYWLSGASLAEAATTTVIADADAHVSAAQPDANFGSSPTLKVDGVPITRSYLRFQISLPPGAVVTRVTLRLYLNSSSPGGYRVALATPKTWSEGVITYNNAPRFGSAVATASTSPAGWNALSVPTLDADSSVTYVVSRSDSRELTVQSRQGQLANRPRLIVEYGFLESTVLETSRSWGTTVADLNLDGLDDYLVTRHTPATVDPMWLQQPGGGFAQGFSLPAGRDRHGCAAGDVSGDGAPDIYCMLGSHLGQNAKQNELWVAGPLGTYVDQAASWGVTDAFGRGRRPVLFDFDNDGRLDLYITNWGPRPDELRSENILYLNAGATFVEHPVSAAGAQGSACVDVADWDGDNRLDILVCGPELQLFRNVNGQTTESEDASLGSAAVFWPRDAALADLSGDGKEDLVIVKAKELQIRLNIGGTARFSRVHRRVPLVDGMSVAVGDLTGDRRQDIYVVQGRAEGRNWGDLFLPGPGWLALEAPPATSGWGNEAEFITVSGREKVLVTNGYDGFDTTPGPTQLIGLHSE